MTGDDGRRAPDAYEPTSNWHLPAGQHGRAAQWQRRSKILAVTRSLLAEHGFSGVTIRMVSLRTDISPQTIHNLVGPRHDMLAAAVCEHIGTLVEFARDLSPEGWFLLGLAHSVGLSAQRNAAYIKESTKAYFPPDQPLHNSIRSTGHALIYRGLQEMKMRGQLQSDCNPSKLARRAILLTNGIMLDWVASGDGPEELREELVQGYMPIMQFALVPDEYEAARQLMAA